MHCFRFKYFFNKYVWKKLHKNLKYFLCYTCLHIFSNVFLAKIAKILEKNSIGRNFWTVGCRKLIYFFKFKEIFRRIQWCDQIGWKMSHLGVVKKVHQITLKTLNRVKHLEIHYQIKFHHIRCNSLADMASLPIPNSLSLVLYIWTNFRL